ncbi:MAG: acyl-CoA/acyl-ACP dehydrogenase [Syntrophomonadaceae bacterium]|mgnify:CR=1 FL=1|nr:acyl-CoA/acyl-ACP dehydrogenase [Syntrophomonadaceae bacterium]
MPAFTLNKERNQLISDVHELSVSKIAERGAYLDRIGDDKVDWKIPEYLAKMNLLAPIIPAEYGGRGLSMMAATSIIEEIALGCAGAAAVVVMNIFALTPLLITGSEKLKQQFLPDLCAERPHLACLAISEITPENDLERSSRPREDITRITTTAELKDDQISLNGTKDFVMNGAASDFVVVLARSKESKQKSHLQMYLVPAKTPGLETGRVLNKVGMRSSHTVQMGFRDASIPLEYRIGRDGGGYFLLTQIYDRNMPLVAAIGVGVARAAFELTLKVARTNKMLNRNLNLNQYVSSALVEMSTEIDAARLAVMRAAYYIDKDDNYSRAAYMSKLYATRVAQRTTFQAVNIIGRLGFTVGHPAEKYLRDAQMLSMIAGSEHLHKQVLSQQI